MCNYFWELQPTFPWVTQAARIIQVSKTSSHVCTSDRGALKHGGIISPSLWTLAYILAELSHPGTLQISISAHKAVLGEHWTVCNVGARSWLTKPRGPEQPSLSLVGGFKERVGGRERVGGQFHHCEEMEEGKVRSQITLEGGGNN